VLELHRDGPELYPDELRFDSEAILSAREHIENGLR
jgi:hypothetical protein